MSKGIIPIPAPRFYRGRQRKLGWIKGQLLYLDNIPFLFYVSDLTGLTFFAIDELEELEELEEI